MAVLRFEVLQLSLQEIIAVPVLHSNVTERHETPVPHARHKTHSHSSSVTKADPQIQAPNSLNLNSRATTSYSKTSPTTSQTESTASPHELHPTTSKLTNGSPKTVHSARPRGSKQSTHSAIKKTSRTKTSPRKSNNMYRPSQVRSKSRSNTKYVTRTVKKPLELRNASENTLFDKCGLIAEFKPPNAQRAHRSKICLDACVHRIHKTNGTGQPVIQSPLSIQRISHRPKSGLSASHSPTAMNQFESKKSTKSALEVTTVANASTNLRRFSRLMKEFRLVGDLSLVCSCLWFRFRFIFLESDLSSFQASCLFVHLFLFFISLSLSRSGSQSDSSLEPVNPPVNGLPSLPDVMENLEEFVLRPAPQGVTIRCRISRDKHGVDRGLFPTYYLHMEREDRKFFLLAARRRKRSTTSNYVISCDATDLSRAAESFAGKLRSNFLGTQFVLYAGGKRARRGDMSAPNRSRASIRSTDSETYEDGSAYGHDTLRELAAVIYDTNVLGFKGPRRMTVLLPRMTSTEEHTEYGAGTARGTLLECWKQKSWDGLMELHNKCPVWNEDTQSYVLNFFGRVTQASVKNFQIVYMILSVGFVCDLVSGSAFMENVCLVKNFFLSHILNQFTKIGIYSYGGFC
ncbi:Tubby protein [Fasciola gigantica]|uniref:Tubby protein n=1 Tax=Fasciola gigantica TaxID=46835 RepID=A0A504YH03_FASGI|nr:Tubby protein [Fasciola gigantica]